MEVFSFLQLGIVGRTGSGKSSLFQVLFRMVNRFEGAVLLDGISLASVPLNILRLVFLCVPSLMCCLTVTASDCNARLNIVFLVFASTRRSPLSCMKLNPVRCSRVVPDTNEPCMCIWFQFWCPCTEKIQHFYDGLLVLGRFRGWR